MGAYPTMARDVCAGHGSCGLAASDARSERFLEALSPFDRVAVVSHANPDPDALASMLGVKALLEASSPGKDVVLSLDGIVARAENQAMVRLLGIPLVPMGDIDFSPTTAVVMVDSQPGNNARLSLAPRVVLDHHETPGSLDGVAFRDIRPDLGATTTLVADYLREQGVHVGSALATGLYYGIQSETMGWPRESSAADDGALVWLFPLIDRDLLAHIRNPRLPQSYFATYQSALANAFRFGDAVFSYCGTAPQPDIVAELADFFIRFDQVSWAFVCGVYESGMRISLRSDHTEAHCGEILRRAVSGLGSAGGHDRRAGGFVPILDRDPHAIESLLTDLRSRVFHAIGIDLADGHRLLDPCVRIDAP